MFDSLFPSHWTTLRKLMWLKLKGASAAWETITGNPVSFTALAAPLRKLQIAFSPVQSGSGDPSPDNVRPISGWSALGVEMRGVNVLDLSSLLTQYGVTFSVDSDGWFTIPNLANPNLYSTHLALPHTITNGSLLLVTDGENSTPNFSARIYSGNTVVNQTAAGNPPTAKINNLTFDHIGFNWSSGGTPHAKFKLLLSLNATAPDAYVPYNPSSRSISISLGSTYYSGLVDAVSGQGEVTMASVDLGTLDWTTASNNRFRADIANIKLLPDNNTYPYGLCSQFAGATPNNYINSDNVFHFSSSIHAVYVRDTSYSDAATFKAAMNSVQLVYELATPIPIQLTPQEINSLAGDNVMWTDAASLEVTYRSN